MELNLEKGFELDLTKSGDTLFTFGLGWDAPDVGEDVDCDASAFMLKKDGSLYKLKEMKDVIYFNHLSSDCGSVRLSGDSRDGNDGDIDEEIYVDTTKIPNDVDLIALYVNIFKPAITFSQVKSAKAVVSNQDNKILAHFDMSGQLSDENSLLVGTIRREGRSWIFTAKGEGYNIKDLNTIVSSLNKDGITA